MKNKWLYNLLPGIALLSILLLVYLLYQPGSKGGFLFDDYPNLKELGVYGGVTDFETFKNFVLNGISSPLGRPVSLASFLLDDNTWPSKAEWFKTTNIKIHLLTGLFLLWATLHLVRLFNIEERRAVWIALFSASIWMLHPYMVSTTLYVVQRMAQLAAMFAFMGLVGYLYGRILLNENRIIAAYTWMTISLGGGTVLGLLSKENGVLLPIMVLAIEYCLPNYLPKLKMWWKLVFLAGPVIAIGYVLGKEINLSPDAWPNRPFTQVERLLTEPRIIWEYLYHLYVPRIEGRGLFQDGYVFSKSLFNPISTLFSLIALSVLLAACFIFRRKYSFWALGFLFYFSAHILESTVIGLELYFEHRNYLSSAFLFLPIANFLIDFEKKGKKSVAVIGCVLVIVVLSLLTWQRSLLWEDTKKLEMYWAASTPESPRAQNKIGSTLLAMGKTDESIQFMEKSLRSFPNSSLLAINTLLIKVYVGKVDEEDFKSTALLMSKQPFDAQAVMGLRNLMEKLIAPNTPNEYKIFMISLLDDVAKNQAYASLYSFQKLMPYLKGQLYLSLDEYDNAYNQFAVAIPMYSETDAALSMVAILANADRPVEAYLLFGLAEEIFSRQPSNQLKRSRELYELEFKRMKLNLEEHMRSVGIEVKDVGRLEEASK